MSRIFLIIISTLSLANCGGGASENSSDRIPTPAPTSEQQLFNKQVLVGSVVVANEYNRNQQYPTWDDTDSDCISNRHEVLIAQHINDDEQNPLILRGDGCAVLSGKWLDPYDDEYYFSASEVQIDHVVALYESHLSGSVNFTSSEQRLYANTGDKLEGTLPEISHQFLVVGARSNQEKGSKDPKSETNDGWMPNNDDYHCTYLKKWVQVKYLNGLYFDREEYEFIKDYESNCSDDPLPDLPEN